MSRIAQLPALGIRLAASQSALLAQIGQTHKENAAPLARGLQAYRANVRMGAALALQVAYPVVAQLIGPASFEAMARHFWHTHPPVRGDWAQWGANLPLFLADSAQLASELYLPDVAKLEWALHQCAGATDAAQDTASFALLTQHEPMQVGLRLSAACVVASAYPIVAIVQAHSQAGAAVGGMAALASIGGADRAEAALVWRKGYAPNMRVLLGAEYAFVSALLENEPLGYALECAGEGFDFSHWLTNCYHDGLVLGACLAGERQLTRRGLSP